MSIESLKKNLLIAYKKCDKTKQQKLVKFHGFKSSNEFLKYLKKNNKINNN